MEVLARDTCAATRLSISCLAAYALQTTILLDHNWVALRVDEIYNTASTCMQTTTDMGDGIAQMNRIKEAVCAVFV